LLATAHVSHQFHRGAKERAGIDRPVLQFAQKKVARRALLWAHFLASREILPSDRFL
jgi:hypothetical protein